MELTKDCKKKNVYQDCSFPLDYTNLNKSKSFLLMRKSASFFISTEQGKTSILSSNQINIPQKVCLYLAVMNLSSQSVAKLNKPMLY
jgi:hypothetical protein